MINSPSGSAAASEEIYQMIKRLADERVLVAYISEYGASGEYYIALPADEIIASPHTLTGSVGAVSVVINLAGLMEKLGIQVENFKSGKLKDIGSGWRPMTDEERRIMQEMINYSAKALCCKSSRSSESMKLSYEILMMWPLPSGIDPSTII